MEVKQYKQTDLFDIVTESNNVKKRGGQRDNSGRKSTHGGKTKTIRVNVALLPKIELLKNGGVEFLTESKNAEIDALKAKLEKYKADNMQLVKERDIALQKIKKITYSESIQLSRYKSLKSDFDDLDKKFLTGTNKVCQCVTSNGTQCTRAADKLIQTNDLRIWACKQNRAKYPNARQVF